MFLSTSWYCVCWLVIAVFNSLLIYSIFLNVFFFVAFKLCLEKCYMNTNKGKVKCDIMGVIGSFGAVVSFSDFSASNIFPINWKRADQSKERNSAAN